MTATDGRSRRPTSMRRARDLRDAADREAPRPSPRRWSPRSITITAKAGAEGKLFGSVTAADVAAADRGADQHRLDRKKLHMRADQDARHLHVTAKLHSDVEFPITVEVVKAE